VRRYGRHWFKKDSLMSEFSDHFGIAVTRHKSSVALRAAKTEAELASKAKSEFIANMSHELRTPLNAVIGFSEMLQHKTSKDPERVREYAGYINEAAEHLLALISSILDVSKIQAGKLQVDRSHIDPDPIVRSCLLITEVKAREKGITVEASLPEGPLSVYADPLRLKQVLINLMSNAVKFTPDNGKVMISVTPGSDEMSIEISDNGVGMTTNEIETAMRPFGQVEQGFNKKYEGTGLGLPISAALVGLHGGRLTVESDKGNGTRVTVLLPKSGPGQHRDEGAGIVVPPAPANAPASTNGTASLPLAADLYAGQRP
jgi:two-component system, cell cycle sensor histidine kinase PleC